MFSEPSEACATCPCPPALRGRLLVSLPLTLAVLPLQPAAGQLQGQRGVGPLVLSLQAQGQRRPPFLQGFQRWTQVEGTLQREEAEELPPPPPPWQEAPPDAASSSLFPHQPEPSPAPGTQPCSRNSACSRNPACSRGASSGPKGEAAPRHCPALTEICSARSLSTARGPSGWGTVKAGTPHWGGRREETGLLRVVHLHLWPPHPWVGAAHLASPRVPMGTT